MSEVLNEMKAVYEDRDGYIAHIGIKRRSGRYPWGSGKDPYQHSEDFLGRIEKLKASGWKETPENIEKEFGLTTTQYRAQKGLATDYRRMLKVARAKSLKSDGLNTSEIARKMGVNESTVRSLLDPNSEAKMMAAKNTADFIRNQINEKGMIDIGKGVEHELGVSKEKLNQALAILESEGYPIYKGGVPQVTNKGQQINQKVICPPGTEHHEIYDYDKVHSLMEYHSNDGGDTFDKYEYPSTLSSKRLKILLKDEVGPDGETGEMKDGLIMIRRGLKDLNIGDSRYSQVRILVDDEKYGKGGYLKGMAVYSDNLPDGIDVMWNTNKLDYQKAIKDIDTKDPMNPFGATITAKGQSHYIDENGERKLNYVNKRADEGDWSEWKDALPAQFLSKQSMQLARQQLGLSVADKQAEFDEIMSLTNPTVKKHLLAKFADTCDGAAVNLQAAALPGQKYHAIIPLNTIKDTEIYAPNYEDGTKLALVRYPHEGTFEIPILTVNNKSKDARELLGTDAVDAVCITKKVADRLSGADFDGDTVMCIPTHDPSGKVKITSTEELEGLKDFDTRMAYPYHEGMKVMKKGRETQLQMGMISNLVTDMTLGGADVDELAAATRHAMVVIDAAKHKLDYKKSEIDNNIESLRQKYQVSVRPDGTLKYGGASTIISKAGSVAKVDKRQGTPKVNMKTKPNGEPNPDYDPSRPEGALIYKTSDKLYYNKPHVNSKTGEVTFTKEKRTQDSTKMAETDDAYTLVSKHAWPMEKLYADYANTMKDMANKARIEEYHTGKIAYDKKAKEIYADEVLSLQRKLGIALVNAPKERAAMRNSNVEIDELKDAARSKGVQLSNEDVKKMSQKALTKYRTEAGSVSRRDRSIKIEDREWEAIQAGAISESKLKQILANTDIDSLRERATPRATTTVSDAKIAQIKALGNSNYTLDQIAKKTGLSATTIAKYLKGAK